MTRRRGQFSEGPNKGGFNSRQKKRYSDHDNMPYALRQNGPVRVRKMTPAERNRKWVSRRMLTIAKSTPLGGSGR